MQTRRETLTRQKEDDLQAQVTDVSSDSSTVTTWELTLTDAMLNSELLHASKSLKELRDTCTK